MFSCVPSPTSHPQSWTKERWKTLRKGEALLQEAMLLLAWKGERARRHELDSWEGPSSLPCSFTRGHDDGIGHAWHRSPRDPRIDPSWAMKAKTDFPAPGNED